MSWRRPEPENERDGCGHAVVLGKGREVVVEVINQGGLPVQLRGEQTQKRCKADRRNRMIGVVRFHLLISSCTSRYVLGLGVVFLVPMYLLNPCNDVAE